jgi:hypothetical protein
MDFRIEPFDWRQDKPSRRKRYSSADAFQSGGLSNLAE